MRERVDLRASDSCCQRASATFASVSALLALRLRGEEQLAEVPKAADHPDKVLQALEDA